MGRDGERGRRWVLSTGRRVTEADDPERVVAPEPITLHECRHSFASLMIAAGVNARALSTYMGHSTIGITLDRYGHLRPGNGQRAASLLAAYLARSDTAARLAQLEPETGANAGVRDSESAL